MSIGNEVMQQKVIKDAEFEFCYDIRYAYDLNFWTNFTDRLNVQSTPWDNSAGSKSLSNIEIIEEDKPPHMLLTGQEGCSVINISLLEKNLQEENAQQMQSKFETHRSLLIQLQRSRISEQIKDKENQNITPSTSKKKNQKNPEKRQIQVIKPVNSRPEMPKERPSYASVSSLRIGNPNMSNTITLARPTVVRPVNPANVATVRPPIGSLRNVKFTSVAITRPKNTVTNNTGACPKNASVPKKANSKKANVSLPNSHIAVANSSTHSASASLVNDNVAPINDNLSFPPLPVLQSLSVNIPRRDPDPVNLLATHIQRLVPRPNELEVYNLNLLIFKYK